MLGWLGWSSAPAPRRRVRVARRAKPAAFLSDVDEHAEERKPSDRLRLRTEATLSTLMTAAAPVAAVALQDPNVAVAMVPFAPLDLLHPPTRTDVEVQLRNVTAVQGCVGATLFVLGDFGGGLLQMGLASWGCYAASLDGAKHLPTFTVVAAGNGVINTLTLAEILPNFHGALLSTSTSAITNLAHVCVIATPILSFAGALSAYTLITVIRAEAGEVGDRLSTAQLAARNQRPEWVPFVGTSHHIGENSNSDDDQKLSNRRRSSGKEATGSLLSL